MLNIKNGTAFYEIYIFVGAKRVFVRLLTFKFYYDDQQESSRGD